MKTTDVIVYLILGALVVLTILSIIKLNNVQKGLLIKSTNGQSTPTTETTQRESVTADELSNALKSKINKQSVKELNITFSE